MSDSIDFNPPQVSKYSIGLGRVNNTPDLDKPVSRPTQAAIDGLRDHVDEALESFSNSVVSLVFQDDTSITLYAGSAVEVVESSTPFHNYTITLAF